MRFSSSGCSSCFSSAIEKRVSYDANYIIYQQASADKITDGQRAVSELATREDGGCAAGNGCVGGDLFLGMPSGD